MASCWTPACSLHHDVCSLRHRRPVGPALLRAHLTPKRWPGQCAHAWHSGQPATAPTATDVNAQPQLLGPGTPAHAPSRQPSLARQQQHQQLQQEAAVLPPPAPQQQQQQQQPSASAPGTSTGFGRTLGRVKRKLLRALHSPYDHAIWNLAAPAVLALAADPLLSMVDTAFVGRLGQEHLGALGVNTSLFSFAFVVFNFLTTATTPMVAAAVSAKDTRQAGEVTWQAGIMAIVLGSGVTLLLLAYADPALQLMGLDDSQPQLLTLARQYLLVRAAAAPAALLVTVGQGVFRGMQNMRVPLMVTVGTNVVHLALAPLFIFHLGLGLEGAALSTVAAEWLAAFWYIQLVWQERAQLGLWPPPQFDVAEAKGRYLPFLQAGSAVLLRTGVLLGTKTMATAVATRLGASSVASHQVLMQLWLLASMVVDSLAVSGQTLVAVALGQGAKPEARRISLRLLQLGLGLGLGLAVVLGASSPWWPGLFTDDGEVLHRIDALLPLALAPLPVNAMVYTLDGVLVGASDFSYMMSAMVGASAIAASTLALVLPMGWGLEGVWASMALLMAARLATLLWRFQSESGPLPPSSTALATTSCSAMTGTAGGAVVAGSGSAQSSCEVDERSPVVGAVLHEAEASLHQHNLGFVPSGHEEAALMSPMPISPAAATQTHGKQQQQQQHPHGVQQHQPLHPHNARSGALDMAQAAAKHVSSVDGNGAMGGTASNAVPVKLACGSMRQGGTRVIRPQHHKVHNGFKAAATGSAADQQVPLASRDERS